MSIPALKQENEKKKKLILNHGNLLLHDAQWVISNQRDLSLQAVEFESGLVCIFLKTIQEKKL